MKPLKTLKKTKKNKNGSLENKHNLWNMFEDEIEPHKNKKNNILDNWNFADGHWPIEQIGASCNSNENIMERWFNA